MKLKKLIITLIVIGILSSGFTVVFAEFEQLDNGARFSIPKGYSIFSNEEGVIGLSTSDKKNIITVITNGTSIDEARKTQLSNGYQIQSETNKTINGVNVTTQHLTKENIYYHNYFFTISDVNYTVSCVTTDNQWNDTDPTHPVNVVMISLINSLGNSEIGRGHDPVTHNTNMTRNYTDDEMHEILCEDD